MLSGLRRNMFGASTVVLAMALALATRGSPQTLRAEPAVTRIVSMEYPAFARMAMLQGTVTLRANVLPDGTPGEVTVLSGPEPLATPARQDLLMWRFARCPSSADNCVLDFAFSFVLSGTCTDSPRCATEFQVDLPGKIRVSSQAYGKVLP